MKDEGGLESACKEGLNGSEMKSEEGEPQTDAWLMIPAWVGIEQRAEAYG